MQRDAQKLVDDNERLEQQLAEQVRVSLQQSTDAESSLRRTI